MTTNSLNRITQESLQEALIQLLETTPLNDISVTALTQKAGVSRMTYYRNYDSMQALFQEALDGFLKQFLHDGQRFLLESDWLGFWTALYQFIYEHRHYIHILLGMDQRALMLDYFNQTFTKNIEDPQLKYFVIAKIGVNFNLMIEWSNRQFDLKPETLAELTSQFIHPDYVDVGNEFLPKEYL